MKNNRKNRKKIKIRVKKAYQNMVDNDLINSFSKIKVEISKDMPKVWLSVRPKTCIEFIDVSYILL